MTDLSPVERIKRDSRLLRGTLAESLGDAITGAIREDDRVLIKFHGSYQQDDRDLRDERRRQKLEPAYSFMIRTRLPGGVSTPQQWLALDAIARRHANGTLRLTTRQAFQLLVGTGWALAARGGGRAFAANAAGLLLSTAYLGWSVGAQWHVERVAQASLAAQGIAAERVLVSPTAFNSVLWRVIAVAGDSYHEGFRSLLDEAPTMNFDRFPRGNQLAAELQGLDGLQRIAAFSKGFYKLGQRGSDVLLSDLRIGQEPHYVFAFVVAQKASAARPVDPPRAAGGRGDTAAGLRWLWARMWGADVAPPR